MAARAYLRDPEAIYRESFARIAAEANLAHLPESLRAIAIRMIHACGMTDLAEDIAWSGDVVGAARQALHAGTPVICDSRMVADGLIAERLCGNAIVCLIGEARVAEMARAQNTTRSAVAVDMWRDQLPGSVVVIGNAPTALFRLIEAIEEGAPRPASIVAMPVGFVGAVESKQALIEAGLGVPFLTVKGRRGGSAIAAAAINAIAGDAP
jgi:precorrin-8X/cobalt-precorrin-8 methylmutase